MRKTFAKNDVIFHQGEKADCMYEIVTGSVGIFANYGKKNEQLLTTLGVCNTFGEMGIIENQPRSATAVAMEDGVVVQMITAEGFVDYFQENPGKVLVIMKHMSSRIRGLTQDYLDACRAVAEAEDAEKGGKKSGWFKDHVKHFLQDYADATVYMNEHPEMYSGVQGYHDHYFL